MVFAMSVVGIVVGTERRFGCGPYGRFLPRHEQVRDFGSMAVVVAVDVSMAGIFVVVIVVGFVQHDAPIFHDFLLGCGWGCFFGQEEFRSLFGSLLGLVPRCGGFVDHLRGHASHANDARPENALPQDMGNPTAGSCRASRLTGKFLRSHRVGRTDVDQTARGAAATSELEARVHDAGTAYYTIVLSFFRGVRRQASFVALIAPRNVEGTTCAKDAHQTTHFHGEKQVGTVLFSVRSRSNRYGSTGTSPSATLGSIVIALPQFVPRHVVV